MLIGSRMGKKYFLVLLAVVVTVLITPLKLGAQPGSEADVIKDAATKFDNEDYAAAMPLYSQLLANHPTDPNYNYRFGVCMLYANADKGKALPYLEEASKDPKAEVEVWFYLGRAYHLNYRFDEAIVAYTKYKTLAGEKKAEKLQVDNQIAMCKTGKKMLKAVTDITVLEKKELAVANFFRAYDLAGYSGELLVKGDEFKTNIDRKKNETSIIFLSGEKNVLYFSSYGDNEENGKDIYRVVRLPNGGWSKPYNVGYPINTEFDEDYPFLHPNGKVLYFCSKGHNSMGGYDIFRSELNEETQTWQKPKNMDFAINSPDDDILFVTDYDEKTAWFASARNSPQGMMTVYHVVIERKPVNMVMISGIFKPTGVDPNAGAKITVRNEETNQPVGVYKSNDQTGAYFISLPNTGGQYTFTVEKSGIHTQTKTVLIPPQYEIKPIRQEIFYSESDGEQDLNIVTYFDEDTAQFAPDFLKEKANLDVNGSSSDDGYEVVDLGNPNDPKNPGNTTDPGDGNDPDDSVDIPGGGTDPADSVPSSNGSVTTAELIADAYTSADDTKKDAVTAHQQADRAFTYAADLNQKTKDKQAEADAAKKAADAMPDGPDKQAAEDNAKKLQGEANSLASQTVAAFNVAQGLTDDANNKDKEATVAQEYAKALDAGSKKTGPHAMDDANTKQQELNDVSAVRPQGAETAKNLQEQADNTREKLQAAKSRAEDAREEKKANEDLIANLRADSAKEKDPDLRAGYASQIEGIQENIEDNNKDIKKADADVAKYQNQLNDLDNQAAGANDALAQSKNPEIAPKPMSAEDKKALNDNVVGYQNRVEDAGNPVVYAPVEPRNPDAQNPEVKNPDAQNPEVKNPDAQNPVVKNPDAQNPDVKNPDALVQNPDVKNPDAQNPVVKNPDAQNPDVKNPDAQNPDVKNPDPLVQNPDVKNPDAQNPDVKNPDPLAQNPDVKNPEPIEPATDAITDIQNGVSEKIQEADNIEDPAQKEKAIGEAHRQAEKDIDAKIADATTDLANEKDPQRREQIQNNIDQLNAAKKDQHEQVVASDNRAEQIGVAATEQPQDPFASYESGIGDADTIADPVAREKTKGDTYTDWANAIDKKIADDKKLMGSLKTKESKDSLKGVIAQEQKQSTDLKQQAKDSKAAEQKAIADQNSPGAKSDKEFEDQITETGSVPNVSEREATKEEIYTTWADSLDNEGNKLDALAAKERNAKKKSDFESQAKDMHAQADEKRALADQSHQAAENAIAQNPANPEPKNPELAVQQDARVEDGVQFTNPDAKGALDQRDVLMDDASGYRKQQDSLTTAAGNASGSDKTKLLGDASEAQRNAWDKEAEASAKQGEANNDQFTSNESQLDAYKAAAAGSNDAKVEAAGLLNDEAIALLKRAQDKRAEAKLATSQFQRNQLLDEAEDLEQQAIKKQQDAIARYQEAGVQPSAVAQSDKNPDGQNPDVKNPDAQNPDVKNPDALVQNPDVKNPDAQNPVVKNPDAQNPVVKNPDAQNPDVKNPDAQNPDVKNPDAQNPDVKNPDAQNPDVKNPDAQNPVVKNPDAQNPDVKNPDAQNPDVKNPEANPDVKNPDPLVNNPKNPDAQNPDVKNPDAQTERIINPATGNPYTAEQVQEIRTSEPYKNYVALDDEAKGYDADVARLGQQADQKQDSADKHIALAQDFALKASDEPDPAKKRTYLDDSKRYNEMAKKDIHQRDSINDLADEKKIDARSKHDQADLYLNELDQKTYGDVKAVADNDPSRNQNPDARLQNPDATNPDVKNPDVQNPDVKQPDPLVQSDRTPSENPEPKNPDVKNPDAVQPVQPDANNQSKVATQLKPGEEFKITAQPNATPIPVDPPVPTGIVYKVQIGAFRNPIPVDLFKGIQPLNAESVGNGITRYTAGLFTEFSNADAAKREIRAMGYPDAFVVAYKDGKRISVGEARRLQGNNEPVVQSDRTPSENPNPQNPNPQNPNPQNPEPVVVQPKNPQPNNPQPNSADKGFVAEATDVKSTPELFYTVQVGVYSRPVSPERLYNLGGLFSERTANGYIRYACGKYDNVSAATAAKDDIAAIGIKDAFVTAYFEGQRITLDKAAELERSGVKPAGNASANVQRNNGGTVVQQTPPQQQQQEPKVQQPEPKAPTWEPQPEPKQPEPQPKQQQPQPQPDPVVQQPQPDPVVQQPQPQDMTPIPVIANTKPNVPDTGLVFSVQLGAYKEFVPIAMANRFLLFASKGVSIYRDVNSGLTVYQVGQYITYKDAQALKDDAIAKGINDAFIVAWHNGEKISVEEALKIRPQ